MRVVRSLDQLAEAFERCQSEATAAFGNGAMFLEEYIEQARHIEVQVLADRHGSVVHLFERDCSVQQRHQKVIEYAPGVGMCDGLRSRLTSYALQLAKAAKYEGLGTVEFLVRGSLSDKDSLVAFMEMNPRIQVDRLDTSLTVEFVDVGPKPCLTILRFA